MRLLFLLLFVLGVGQFQFAQHKSILLIEGEGACEPSIKLDPNNPNRVVAGAVLNHVLYSEDGGLTWAKDKLISPLGVWGDPVIEVDTAGAFYYFHLSNPADGDWIDRIVCQRSDDGGKSWSKEALPDLMVPKNKTSTGQL